MINLKFFTGAAYCQVLQKCPIHDFHTFENPIKCRTKRTKPISQNRATNHQNTISVSMLNLHHKAHTHSHIGTDATIKAKNASKKARSIYEACTERNSSHGSISACRSIAPAQLWIFATPAREWAADDTAEGARPPTIKCSAGRLDAHQIMRRRCLCSRGIGAGGRCGPSTQHSDTQHWEQ